MSKAAKVYFRRDALPLSRPIVFSHYERIMSCSRIEFNAAEAILPDHTNQEKRRIVPMNFRSTLSNKSKTASQQMAKVGQFVRGVFAFCT